MQYRYRYINQAYLRSGFRHGIFCNPVKTEGKCIVGRGNQLVTFENGHRAIVIRRCLRLVILIAVLSFGCSEPIHEIYMERGCPFIYGVILESAIDEMNDQYHYWYPDETLIEYKGTVEYHVTDIDTTEAKNDNRDVMVCSAEPGYNPVGHAVEGADVLLYVERIETGKEHLVVYHELGHYVGMEHSGNEKSVMYPYLWDQKYPWFTEGDWRSIQ